RRRLGERLALAERAATWLESTNATPAAVNPLLESVGSAPIREPTRLAAILRRPNVGIAAVLGALDADPLADAPEADRAEVWAARELELRYAGHLAKERERAEALRRQSDFAVPEDLPYLELTSLSTEARQKLDRVRPLTLGQAGRIPGISPSDLQNLVMEVRKRRPASARPA